MNTLTANTIENTPIKNEKIGFIVTTVMLVAILEVLDSTIVNVSLHYMMPSLGANSEQITWVLTSYIVAAAVMLPLTGFLTKRLGQRQLLLINTAGFMFSSIACGLATSLPEMVVFRLLQGAFGAALIPLSQVILRTNFSKKQQATAMTIWALGIMVAPVFGPTIGGYITQHSNWRWVFYINVPICAIAFIMTCIFIKDSEHKRQPIDYLGIILMFIGVGTLQTFLDQGNNKNWFDSNFIIFIAIASFYCLSYFIIRSLRHRSPVINLKIFKNRNFTITTMILTIYCGCLFGTITLEPLMLESLFHYTALIAGNTLMAVGAGSIIIMSIIPILLKSINEKIILSFGLIINASALWYLSTLNINTSETNFIIGNLLLGVGIGFIMVPLSTYSLLTVPKAQMTEAAGLYSYGRMLGSSIGISIFTTITTRLGQINWHSLGARLTDFSPNLQIWLNSQGLNLQQPTAVARLGQTLNIQSQLVSFISTFRIIAFTMLLLIPLVWLIKHVDLHNKE
ncbi:MAG: DHA2 family efflux MFS transporter permease subunit [Gammaproteobacteria bacterium]|nr:DHA2 family efflux MFS transporter permease subunit [Gammaproteobacteria bacterium]